MERRKTRQSSAAVRVTSAFCNGVLTFEGRNLDTVIWLPTTFLMSAVNSSAEAAPRPRKRRVASGASFRISWSIQLAWRTAQELLTHLHAYPPQRDGNHHVGRTRAQWASAIRVRLYAS